MSLDSDQPVKNQEVSGTDIPEWNQEVCRLETSGSFDEYGNASVNQIRFDVVVCKRAQRQQKSVLTLLG